MFPALAATALHYKYPEYIYIASTSMCFIVPPPETDLYELIACARYGHLDKDPAK